jgi:hypothetical protein
MVTTTGLGAAGRPACASLRAGQRIAESTQRKKIRNFIGKEKLSIKVGNSWDCSIAIPLALTPWRPAG